MDALLPFKDRHLAGMYHGTLAATGFKLQRLIVARALLPKLTGKYAASDSGTIITVSTNKNELTTSVIGMTIGLLLPCTVILLTVAITSDDGIWVVPVIFLITGFMYAYIQGVNSQITAETEKDRKILSELLDAQVLQAVDSNSATTQRQIPPPL